MEFDMLGTRVFRYHKITSNKMSSSSADYCFSWLSSHFRRFYACSSSSFYLSPSFCMFLCGFFRFPPFSFLLVYLLLQLIHLYRMKSKSFSSRLFFPKSTHEQNAQYMCERDIYLFIFAIIPINREWLHLIASEQRQRQKECQSHVFIVIVRKRFDFCWNQNHLYSIRLCIMFVLFIFVFLLTHEQCFGNNDAGCGRDLIGFFHVMLPGSGIICVGIYIFITIFYYLEVRFRQTIFDKLTLESSLECQKSAILNSMIEQSAFCRGHINIKQNKQ